MKPVCPIFREPCLEKKCSAFFIKTEPTYITADGQGRFRDEDRSFDYCGMLNREWPNKEI